MPFRAALLALILMVGAAACGSDDPAGETSSVDDVTRLWIGPDLVDCEGAAPQTCLLVSESEGGEQEFFYDQIEGFTHVVGTSYVIDVEITEVDDPPADGSSLSYRLVSIVSET